MAQPKIQRHEIVFAYQLMRYLGANMSNPYIIRALIAWVRAESGQNYIGNNPLNIRNSRFAVNYRYTRSNGRFAIFANLQAAAKATAEFLKAGTAYGYGDIIAALRRGSGTKDADLQEQARDVLIAIAMSKWSSTHYGYGRKPDPAMSEYDEYHKNRIIGIWAALLGQKITIPKDAEPKGPEPPPLPKQPRPGTNVIPTRDFIQPYQMVNWYNSRYEPTPALPFVSPIEGQ